jgi:hypothetical protein
MAGTLIISNLTTDTDNTFIVRSNTGTTLFSANTTGIDIANSIGATAITNDKILSVANTKISGNIISSQIASDPTFYGNVSVTGTLSAGAVSGTTGTFTSTLGVTGAITGSSTVAGSTGILYPLTSGTAVASTSGTSIDFTGIPSWVKRITVMFNGVSTNGTSIPMVQLGAGSVDAASYSTMAGLINTTNNTTRGNVNTTGFSLSANAPATSSAISGFITFSLVGSNVWTSSGAVTSVSDGNMNLISGVKTLSGTLDRIRLTTVNGTDTFDAGSVNILYE